jgi:hypothetical protein
MHGELATLSSLSSSLDELLGEISAAAERLAAAGDETAAVDLYEVERALGAASSRLRTTVRRLR